MVVSQGSDDPLGRLRAQIAEARRGEQASGEAISVEVGVGADPLERLMALIAGKVEGDVEAGSGAVSKAPACGGPASKVTVSVSTGGASRALSGEAVREPAEAEAWVGRAVLDLLAQQPLPGPARAELARALSVALSRPSISAEDLRPMLALVLSGRGPIL